MSVEATNNINGSASYSVESTAVVPPASALMQPLSEGAAPLDALALMLLSLEQQNQASLSSNVDDIQAAREQLEELQKQLAEELKKALEAARKAEKEGGWFSRTFGDVVDAVAKVFAKHIEVLKDVVVFPADVAYSFATNLGNREALLESLRNDLGEFTESSETEQAVSGFVSGTLKFTGDLMAFQVVLLAAIAEGSARGDLGDLVRERGVELWHSLEANILENPDFWKVTERILQAVAVAGAVASGGTLAWVAVGLVLVLDADKRYGFIEDAVGEEAAPWVRAGLAVALAVSVGAGAGGWLEGGARILQGAGQAYQGYKMMQEADRQADALEREADVQETLDSIQETQRLIAALIELYEEKSEHRNATYRAGVELVETQASTNNALVFQG